MVETVIKKQQRILQAAQTRRLINHSQMTNKIKIKLIISSRPGAVSDFQMEYDGESEFRFASVGPCRNHGL